MAQRSTNSNDGKAGHHPRSRHREPYDYHRLIDAVPELRALVSINAHGNPSIDFADADAVRTLNRALLVADYGVTSWDLPPTALCPAVPGRADHVHAVADLLKDEEGAAGSSESITALDIGVGASCIYPIIGRHEYGWRFVATDADQNALESARSIAAANPGLSGAVEFRLAADPADILNNVLRPGDRFDLTLCNPPFYGSKEEAEAANLRKRRGLASLARGPIVAARNFGGRSMELWCDGGERGFIRRMIEQSALVRDQCRWFTTLVSKKGALQSTERALARIEATQVRILPIRHGHKTSRILAWTFR